MQWRAEVQGLLGVLQQLLAGGEVEVQLLAGGEVEVQLLAGGQEDVLLPRQVGGRGAEAEGRHQYGASLP